MLYCLTVEPGAAAGGWDAGCGGEWTVHLRAVITWERWWWWWWWASRCEYRWNEVWSWCGPRSYVSIADPGNRPCQPENGINLCTLNSTQDYHCTLILINKSCQGLTGLDSLTLCGMQLRRSTSSGSPLHERTDFGSPVAARQTHLCPSLHPQCSPATNRYWIVSITRY